MKGSEEVSIQLNVSYLDEMPQIERPRIYSKYELAIKKFLLKREPVAQIKAPSSKQAATIVSSFRREIKKHGYSELTVVRRDKTIYLVKKEQGG